MPLGLCFNNLRRVITYPWEFEFKRLDYTWVNDDWFYKSLWLYIVCDLYGCVTNCFCFNLQQNVANFICQKNCSLKRSIQNNVKYVAFIHHKLILENFTGVFNVFRSKAIKFIQINYTADLSVVSSYKFTKVYNFTNNFKYSSLLLTQNLDQQLPATVSARNHVALSLKV